MINHAIQNNFTSAYIAAVENAGAASGIELKIKAPTGGRVMVNNANILNLELSAARQPYRW